jgi:hypothetical protein
MTSSANQVERLVRRLEKLYPSQVINDAPEKVEQRVRLNPARFKRALFKAKAYANRDSHQRAYILWIACHLYDLMEKWAWCFYCGKPFNDHDFLGPDVQLEHFIARSKSPMPDLFGRLPYDAHHPHRIVLSCRACNSIKSNHSSSTLAQVAHDPEAFFKTRRYTRNRKEHMKDFAELYYPLTRTEEYAEHNKITLAEAQGNLKSVQERYRRKWET